MSVRRLTTLIAALCAVLLAAAPSRAVTPNAFGQGINKYNGMLSPVTGQALPDLKYSDDNTRNWAGVLQAHFIYITVHVDNSAVWNDWKAGAAAEGANVAFFTGHGYPSGWVFGTYKDKNQAQPGNFSFGTNGYLKWLTLDACNILANDSSTDAWKGTTYTRWSGSFSGLHSMTSVVTTINDGPYRGYQYAQYETGDMSGKVYSVKNAWFQAVAATDSTANAAIYGIKGYDRQGNYVDTEFDTIYDVRDVSNVSMYFITQS